jgi:NAD(P)-dependent dehydrogenase (short-subunit alcohol dehydrogenase family)
VSSTSKDRIALVTGAAGLVGAAVVSRLQREGFEVAGLDLKPCAGDLSLAVDVTDRDAMRAAVKTASSELGPISVLVTAAGAHDAAPIGVMSRDRWQGLLAAHLGGTINAIAAVVPSMVAEHLGTVVTMSSWLAFAGLAGEAYYAAATGTVLAFTKSFSVEVAPEGVRVNCIAVGPLATDDKSAAAQYVQSELPVGRCVSVDEVAETVAFLVRDGEFYVGQVFELFAGAVV